MLCGGELNPRDNGRELSQRDEEEGEEEGRGKGEEEATIDSLARLPESESARRHRGRRPSASAA